MQSAEFASLIRRSPDLLAKAKNVGETGDWDDLYTVIDFLTYAFGQAYPSMPCKAGCSHCCEEMLFRVTEVEWRAIAGLLDTWSEGDRRALVERIRSAFGPYRTQLEALADFWSSTPWGTPGAPMAGLPTRCPFLDPEGRCGIYELRPLVCRAYGHFGVTLAGKPTMLICRPFGPGFIEGLSQDGVENLVVPPIEPFYQKLEELGTSRALAPLPLWALRWAETSN